MARKGRVQDFLKGRVQLMTISKTGDPEGEFNFGPNVKKPTSWATKVDPDPLDPPRAEPLHGNTKSMSQTHVTRHVTGEILHVT